MVPRWVMYKGIWMLPQWWLGPPRVQWESEPTAQPLPPPSAVALIGGMDASQSATTLGVWSCAQYTIVQAHNCMASQGHAGAGDLLLCVPQQQCGGNTEHTCAPAPSGSFVQQNTHQNTQHAHGLRHVSAMQPLFEFPPVFPLSVYPARPFLFLSCSPSLCWGQPAPSAPKPWTSSRSSQTSSSWWHWQQAATWSCWLSRCGGTGE